MVDGSSKLQKIYLPTYLCDSVTGACEETKVEIEFYHMDEKLCPLLPEKKLPDGEYLYLVNYYGQLTDDRIRQYREIYGNIIVDHTHDFSEAFAWRGYFVLLPEIPGGQRRGISVNGCESASGKETAGSFHGKT